MEVNEMKAIIAKITAHKKRIATERDAISEVV